MNAEDDFVDCPSLGWTMPRYRKPARIHLDGCAVPDAIFADDCRCTCGLREAIDEAATA